MKAKHIATKGVTILTAAMLVACMDPASIYQGTEQEQKEKLSGPEYAAKFQNFSEVTINITSDYEHGRYYSIYESNPYDENGSIALEPLLRGLTPIENENINVASGTDSLFVITDTGMKGYPLAAKLTLTDADAPAFTLSTSSHTRAASRAGETMTKTELEAAIKEINNNQLPEKAYNIKGEALYTRSDLYINELVENQEAHIWATYIGDGGCGKTGYLWYYTYKMSNPAQQPTLSDCTFYGKDATGNFVKVGFEDLKNKSNPAFIAQTDNLNKECELTADFSNGTFVGFVYWGDGTGLRFTTPSLNQNDVNIIKSDGKYTGYKGQNVNYGGGEVFTIDTNKDITSGAIFHFNSLNKQYNVVGMENRMPTEGSYDGDYNDMMLLVRSDPETINPYETIPEPELILTSFRRGLWLFEDNWPGEGDNDFNDVVVAYNMKKAGGIIEVDCKVVAWGCSYLNKFGIKQIPSKADWKNTVDSIELFKNISGYHNVYEQPELNFSKDYCPQVLGTRFTCSDYTLLLPYIDNGKGQGTATPYSFNTTNYPYVVDVPYYSEKTSESVNRWFRWMIEGNDINKSYTFAPTVGNRSNDWFWNSKIRENGGEDYVVKRAAIDSKDDNGANNVLWPD